MSQELTTELLREVIEKTLFDASCVADRRNMTEFLANSDFRKLVINTSGNEDAVSIF